jgi:hypothetical protein
MLFPWTSALVVRLVVRPSSPLTAQDLAVQSRNHPTFSCQPPSPTVGMSEGGWQLVSGSGSTK